MKNILKIGLLLLLMVVSFNTFGTNYYVNDNSRTGDVYCSVVGNNANNGKTTSTPKLTLYNLWTTYGPAGTNVIVAGDVIYVDAGTYSNEESTAMLNSFVITKGITIKGAGKFLTIFNCNTFLSSIGKHNIQQSIPDEISSQISFVCGFFE